MGTNVQDSPAEERLGPAFASAITRKPSHPPLLLEPRFFFFPWQGSPASDVIGLGLESSYNIKEP